MQMTPVYDLNKSPNRYLFGLKGWDDAISSLRIDFQLTDHEITAFLCGRHGYRAYLDSNMGAGRVGLTQLMDYIENNIVQFKAFFEGDMENATIGYADICSMLIERDIILSGFSDKYKKDYTVTDRDIDIHLPENLSIRNFQCISRLQLGLLCAIIERKQLRECLEPSKVRQLVRLIESSKVHKNFGVERLLTVLKQLNSITDQSMVIPFIIKFEEDFMSKNNAKAKRNEIEETAVSTATEGNPNPEATLKPEAVGRKKAVEKAVKEVSEKVKPVKVDVNATKLIVPLSLDEHGNAVNPRKADTHGHRSFNIILEHYNAPDATGNRGEEVMTVADYKRLGGRSNDLAWDIDKKFVKLVDISGESVVETTVVETPVVETPVAEETAPAVETPVQE